MNGGRDTALFDQLVQCADETYCQQRQVRFSDQPIAIEVDLDVE